MKLINTLSHEVVNGTRSQTKIFQTEEGMYEQHYYINGNFVKAEQFPGKSIFYVEDAATNWFQGIKQLNG